MHDPQQQLLDEIGWGCSQENIARTYAFIIRQEGDAADWHKINAAIKARWKGKSALGRVKKMAWKFAQGE